MVHHALQQVYVTQAGQQVEMLKAFLPASFARNESMGVDTVLSAARVPTKVEVLMQFVNEQVHVLLVFVSIRTRGYLS